MTRSYRRGTLLIEEGTQGDCLYLVLSGRLRAFAQQRPGRAGHGEVVARDRAQVALGAALPLQPVHAAGGRIGAHVLRPHCRAIRSARR